MSELVIPGNASPNNLSLPEGTQAIMVESDMYSICDRVKEISSDLFIVLLQDDNKYSYAIMEKCKDGVERLVYKVKELDGRVLDRLRYLMKVPLTERMETLEKEEHRMEKDRKEQEVEELYERMGEPMRWQLQHDGFADRRSFYSRDYSKRGN